MFALLNTVMEGLENNDGALGVEILTMEIHLRSERIMTSSLQWIGWMAGVNLCINDATVSPGVCMMTPSMAPRSRSRTLLFKVPSTRIQGLMTTRTSSTLPQLILLQAS